MTNDAPAQAVREALEALLEYAETDIEGEDEEMHTGLRRIIAKARAALSPPPTVGCSRAAVSEGGRGFDAPTTSSSNNEAEHG